MIPSLPLVGEGWGEDGVNLELEMLSGGTP